MTDPAGSTPARQGNKGMSFDTHLLDKAIAERSARREALRQQLLAEVLRLLDELGPAYGLSHAYIFGSVLVPGRFHEASDVDVAVGGLDPAGFFDLMTALSTTLGWPVDLVALEKCHFARRICQEGMLWTKEPFADQFRQG